MTSSSELGPPPEVWAFEERLGPVYEALEEFVGDGVCALIEHSWSNGEARAGRRSATDLACTSRHASRHALLPPPLAMLDRRIIG